MGGVPIRRIVVFEGPHWGPPTYDRDPRKVGKPQLGQMKATVEPWGDSEGDGQDTQNRTHAENLRLWPRGRLYSRTEVLNTSYYLLGVTRI